MAALPPVPGVAKIIVKQSQSSQNIFNVLHAQAPLPAATTSAGLQNLATAVRQAWVTNVLPLQTASLALGDVQVIDLSSDTGEEGVATGNNVGSAPGNWMSANVAVCWSWKIQRRYRGGHSRTYIGGLPSSIGSNANTIFAADVAKHIAAAQALRNAVNAVPYSGSTWSLCCVHYFRDKAILANPLISPIIGVNCDNRLDSQRRRLGRDRN